MSNDVDEVSTEASIREFDKKYSRRGLSSQRMYPNEPMVQFILGRFGLLSIEERRAIRILEIGCGSGANLWMLAKEGFSVSGLDASETAISLAKSHLAQKWGVASELAVGDFTSLPYPSSSFDVVIDVVSLQHLNLHDTAVALSEVARVMKPTSAFFSYRLSDRSCMYLRNTQPLLDVATVQNISSPFPLANNGPTSFIGPALVRSLYGKVGLSIESIQSFGRTYKSGDFVEYLAIEAQLTQA